MLWTTREIDPYIMRSLMLLRLSITLKGLSPTWEWDSGGYFISSLFPTLVGPACRPTFSQNQSWKPRNGFRGSWGHSPIRWPNINLIFHGPFPLAQRVPCADWQQTSVGVLQEWNILSSHTPIHCSRDWRGHHPRLEWAGETWKSEDL